MKKRKKIIQSDEVVLEKITSVLILLTVLEKKDISDQALNSLQIEIIELIKNLSLSIHEDANKLKFCAMCSNYESVLHNMVDFDVIETITSWEKNIDLINNTDWDNTLTLHKILEQIRLENGSYLEQINSKVIQNSYLKYDDSLTHGAIYSLERVLPIKTFIEFLSNYEIQTKLLEMNVLDRVMEYASQYSGEFPDMEYLEIYNKLRKKPKTKY